MIRELQTRLSRKRRSCLLSQKSTERPAPYDEAAFSDILVSSDCLVPLHQFKVIAGTLEHEDWASIILPPTPSLNSSYWLTQALFRSGLMDCVSVRLDPLIHGPASDFPRLGYRMLWYGPPLLWKDIDNIQVESFGRWAPSRFSNAGEYTDYAWVPRGNELHLLLEEVPRPEESHRSVARYFHVIFSRTVHKVIHLDGAIRIYTEDECRARRKVHVHRAGKVGTRVKVFRLDTPVEPDSVSNIGGAFFVWNYDVGHFFGGQADDWLLGSKEIP